MRSIGNTYTQTLPPSVKEEKLQFADKLKKPNNDKPAHKTAHLQTPPANAQPKFAKELFFASPLFGKREKLNERHTIYKSCDT